MENAKLPLREIKKRYTRSDMAVISWRSAEMAYNMKKSMHGPQDRQIQRPEVRQELYSAVSDPELDMLEQRLGPVAVKLEEQGEDFSMSKLTGEEALRFMNAMGIPFSPGITREIK